MIQPSHLRHKKQQIFTQNYTPHKKSIDDHFLPNIELLDVFTKGEIWAHMTNLENHKVRDIHGLKLELLKWATNDLCEPIKKLFNLVAKEGFTTTWTINIIQVIFEYGERHTLRNYRTIMLETIFG